jgi:hypothetical protein
MEDKQILYNFLVEIDKTEFSDMVNVPNYFDKSMEIYLQEDNPSEGSNTSLQFYTAIETWNNNATVYFLTGVQPLDKTSELPDDIGTEDALESTKVKIQTGDSEKEHWIFMFKDQYAKEYFQGIFPDTGAAGVSTAG